MEYSTKLGSDTAERRAQERRSWSERPSYPFLDSNGDWVVKNRRLVLDRRLNCRSVQETHQSPTDLKLVVHGEQLDEAAAIVAPDTEVSQAEPAEITLRAQADELTRDPEQASYTKDVRNISDRRCMQCAPVFPFKDGDGFMVYGERRKTPDRRINFTEEFEWLV